MASIQMEEPELYDLRRDPGERFNVIAEYPEELSKLSRIADEMRSELGDDLRGVEGSGRREPGRVEGR